MNFPNTALGSYVWINVQRTLVDILWSITSLSSNEFLPTVANGPYQRCFHQCELSRVFDVSFTDAQMAHSAEKLFDRHPRMPSRNLAGLGTIGRVGGWLGVISG